MFRGLINDAKSAAGSLIAKYLARASVAVPFVVALGFATAAITLMLVERFGTITASWIVAGGFTLIGLVATLAVSVKEHEEEVAEKQAEEADTTQAAADAAAQAAAQMPLALLGAVLSTPMGPSTVAGGAKMVARNMPLVVLLALIALLFWPSEPAAAEEAEADEAHAGRPNGAGPRRQPNGYHPEAAA
jgi:uncharacterized membrane protein